MERVLILGCPGAGKSTLARRLAARFGLPLVHLDQMYWRPNWVEPSKQEWQRQLATELAKPTWIMDGNYGRTLAQRLEAAETVIFLDLPRWCCMARIVKRTVGGWGQIRPDMASGCPERFDIALFRYVWNFPSLERLDC